MPICIVKGCKNRSSMKSSRQEELEKTTKITFHAFPKRPAARQLWQNSIGLDNLVLPKHATVCSVHFRAQDFDRTSLSYVRLKPDVIPYLKFPKDTEEKFTNECTQTSSHKASSSSLRLALLGMKTDNSVVLAEPLKFPTGTIKHPVDTISLDEPIGKVPKVISPLKTDCLRALLQTSEKSTQVEMSLVDKSTCVSPKRLFHSPEKDQLREEIVKIKKNYQSQLKVLKQINSRNIKRIENLQTNLRLLKRKNLLEDEQMETH